MPINAAIPMSFQAPELDVNAMMQQRAAGMEGIYKIERQRTADAQAAQEAEAEKLAQALAPAVASAFSDPSDAGLNAALGLVPAQYRSAAQAQLDQLRGIPDVNQRKNVIRASLAQDAAGQAILAQLEPTANARLNADMAAQRAALDRRRLQLEEKQLVTGERMTPYQEAHIALQREKQAAELKKGTAEETKVRLAQEKRARDVEFAVKEVEAAMQPGGLIDQSTGSYVGNMIDTAAQAIGVGTSGAVANAQMKPVADLVLKLVPRFEGPQSDKDTQSYKDAAGDLANPNVPASVKKAAAKQIVELLKKYEGQFEYGGESGGAAPGVIDFGDLGD